MSFVWRGVPVNWSGNMVRGCGSAPMEEELHTGE